MHLKKGGRFENSFWTQTYPLGKMNKCFQHASKMTLRINYLLFRWHDKRDMNIYAQTFSVYITQNNRNNNCALAELRVKLL